MCGTSIAIEEKKTRKEEEMNGGNKSSTDIFLLRDVMFFDRVLLDVVPGGDGHVDGFGRLEVFIAFSLAQRNLSENWVTNEIGQTSCEMLHLFLFDISGWRILTIFLLSHLFFHEKQISFLPKWKFTGDSAETLEPSFWKLSLENFRVFFKW